MPGCPQDGLQDLLETELAEGNCLILLDGYDEVIQAQDREKIAERIDEFVNDYPPLNRFLVTSRIIGYHSVPLRGAFLQYTLQPMDKQQVREFLRRWCPVIGKTQDSKVDRNMIEETRETLLKLELTSPGMEHLISNPLLLRKMAFIYRPGVTLPTTRVELYQMVTETMASWRKSQNEPTSALVTETYLTPLLSELAYWIQHNSPTGIATIKDICNEFSKHPAYFKKWAEDNHLPWDQENPTTQMERVVQNFLEAAKQRTGLLVEQEPNCYSFTHRPFQEYYAARYLTSSDTRIRLIRDHLHDPYWDQPIILTIGFVGWKSSVEKTTELIERAILEDGAPDPDPYEDLIGRNYVFTLRCLADHVPINDNLMERLITRLTKELLYEEGSAGFDRYQQSLQERLKYLRGSPTAAKLLPKLVNATVDADADVRLRAITALGALRQYSPQLQKNLITELQNGNPAAEIAAQCLGELGNASSEVRNRLVRALRDPVRDKATRKAAADALGKLGRTSPEAVQDLLATMKDINASVHELVEATLKNLQYPTQEVIKILLDVLGSTNIPSIRSTLITILSKWGQVIPNQVISTLLKDLQSKGTYVSIRAAAAKSLGELLQPSPEVVTTLLGALHDRDSSVGKAAAKSLGELHYPTTITSEKLIKILELVLKGVTEIPEEMRSPTTELEKWIETLKDERRQVHEQAPGNPQEERYSTAMIVKGLTDILKCLVPGTSIYKDVAKEVAKSLEEVRYPTAIVVNELIKILEMKSQVNPESGPEVRQEAATTLGNLAQKFPELTLIYPILDTLYNSTLSESNPGARFAATMSLGKLKDTSGKVVRGLIGGLRKAETKDVSGATTTDLYAFARAAAAENLERWGQISSEDVEGAMEGVVKELRDALHDKDLIVCLSAARSLSKLQPSSPDAQEVLLKALTSPENSYRRYSAALLGQFGMYNESTLQILWGELPNTSTKLASGLRDEDPEVASTCAQALAQIVRRFPDRAEEIQSRLAEAIRKREFDPRILPLRRSAHNYAFEALWLLVVGGTLRKQPSLPYSLKEPPTNR